MTGIVVLASLIGFILMGLPVSVSIPAAAFAGFIVAGWGGEWLIVTQQLVDGVDRPTLVALPFFIFAGSLMNRIGLTDRIFNLALAFVGQFRAGLAHVNVVGSLIFSGISGSATADLAGLGQIEVEAMKNRGYKHDFSAALTIVTSIVGPVIPPSITLIVYAWLANTSVARLFLAGIIPGLLIGLALMAYIRVTAIWTDYPKEPPMGRREIRKALVEGIPALVAPLIILFAITFGLTTATEAGVIASVYALLLGLCYRSVSMRELWSALSETATVTAFIMMIIAGSHVMSWILTFEQVPQAVADVVLPLVESRETFILMVIALLFVVGFFLEATPSLIILVPLLLPTVDQYDIDRVQFGIIAVMTLLTGIATPPVGVGLYVMSGMTKIPLERLSIAVLPMLIPVFVAIFAVAYVPALSLWLPNLVMGH